MYRFRHTVSSSRPRLCSPAHPRLASVSLHLLLTASCLGLVVEGAASLLAPAAYAQSTSAALSGTVADPSGSVVADATIVLRNTDTSVEQTARTSGSGTFSIVNILPGSYSVRATKPGFSAVEQTDLVLQVNQTATLNFTLPVGNEQQTVTVTSEVSTVESSTAELGTVISQRPVQDLPLNGRNFTQLLTLTPGVSPISTGQNSGGGGGFAGGAIGTFTFPSVNGQRNRSNMFLLDGINDLAFIGNYNYSPIVDDIQEFKVQSHNDLAEFGQVSGGIINVASKGGTNTFHGSVWEFLRNEKLDARNYFLPTRNPLRQNQFGVTFGGPLTVPHLYKGKDHTFFFFAYEGYRQNQNSQTVLQAPTNDELNGDFSTLLSQGVVIYNPFSTTIDATGGYHRDPFPNNQIPANLINSASVLYAKTLLPLESTPGLGNLFDTTKSIIRSNNYSGRIDESLGTHDTLFGRISYSDQPESNSAGYPGFLNAINIESWNISAHETHVFSPTTILDVSFGRNVGSDLVFKTYPNAPANFGQALVSAGFASQFLTGFGATKEALIPSIPISGYASSGPQNIQNTQLANTYEVGVDFTHIIGRHTIKVGGIYNSLNYNGPIAGANENFSAFQTSNLEMPNSASGATTGDAFASFLLGTPTSAYRRDTLETEHGGSIDGGYIQDQFKVTPTFSINVGFRYDVSIWPSYGDLSNGQGYVGDLDLTNGVYYIAATPPPCSATVGAPCIPGGTLPDHVAVTKNGNRSLHNTDYGNWQGRVGMAYRIRPATSLRAGYSRFYDDWNGVSQYAQNVNGNWPSIGQFEIDTLNENIPSATVTDPLHLATGTISYPPPTPFNEQTFYFNPDMKTPYVDQWNLGVDQDLGGGSTLSLAYAGSHAGRLDLGGIKNTATFAAPGDAATVATRRPYPYITPTFYDDSTSNSNYNALEARLAHATHNGLTYLVSYTWSKSIDLASSGDFGSEGTELQNPYNPRADRSVSGFDLTNIFSASVVYELPFGRGKPMNPSNSVLSYLAGGWQVNAITTLNSGAPFDVTFSGDLANTGNNFVRVNQIGAPFVHGSFHNKELNLASFVAPPADTFGTMGRNSLRGDWNRNLDLSAFRTFPVKEFANIEFRAESFNLTNSTVFSNPANTINSSNFGVITSTANTPRQIQLALKIKF